MAARIVTSAILDDLSRDPPWSSVGTAWRLLTDGVMGGVSTGRMTRETIAGRPALRLRGEVGLANNGGFVQIFLDLSPDGGVVDASRWGGIAIDLFGDGEDYSVHLRTDALARPWQSYRQTVKAPAGWETYRLPFDRFLPHRTDMALDTRRLRRIGVVAIGRAFAPNLALGGLRFMTASEPSTETSA